LAIAYQILEPEQAETLTTVFPQFIRQGTNFPVSFLAYDAALDEAATWKIDVTDYLSGNITVNIVWAADAATSGVVVWGASIACITPNSDTQDVTTDTLASESTTATTHLGTTARRLMQTTVTVSNLDSIAAGDSVWIRVRRVGSSGSDTMTGDAWLERVIISYLTP